MCLYKTKITGCYGQIRKLYGVFKQTYTKKINQGGEKRHIYYPISLPDEWFAGIIFSCRILNHTHIIVSVVIHNG